MSNYLNQIESDLYKLHSITNSNGEVVEMVAELKEKYRKAKLADDIIMAWKTGDFDFTEDGGSLPDHGIAPVPNYHMFDFGQYVDSLLDEYESGE